MICKDKEVIIDGKRYKLTPMEPQPPRLPIDWTKMPGDTLAEVRDYNSVGWSKRYFKDVQGPKFNAFSMGATSYIDSSHSSWDQIRLITNPPRPWFGGDMPCCGNVRVKVWRRDGSEEVCWAKDIDDWSCRIHYGDIIAYSMLGEDVE